ncbi:MAG: 3-phosphoshikimate 1-carboxyvinyltransferase [Bacteroidaceae bacterium]|nr:3-phosphoshikimate 1-carboxyvinyltransferase [Bacteroidaceae bacterium]
MQIKVTAPKDIRGRVVLPSSKSISNRALTISALAGGEGQVENVSDCDDTRVMQAWLKERPEVVDIGAAGTAMRFSTALLAVSEGVHVITGSERMKHRPIGILVNALRALGAQIEYVEEEGFPPLRIVGNPQLEGGKVELSGSVSSQYISALLMIGPVLKNGLILNLIENIVSRPYIDMTLAVIRSYGAKVGWKDAQTIIVEPMPYQPGTYQVENDWSAASYWYEMVALAPNADAEVVLPGLFVESLQGDSRGAEVFERLGVSTEHRGDEVVLRKNGKKVERLDVDFVEMPDLAQTFVVTCCMMGIPFHFTGLQSLKIKETDRIEALKRELKKLGFEIEDRNDSELLFSGERCKKVNSSDEIAIDTYEDHRMAMAFAPVALKDDSIVINNPHVVSKSYPHYWDDLQSVNFEIEAL